MSGGYDTIKSLGPVSEDGLVEIERKAGEGLVYADDVRWVTATVRAARADAEKARTLVRRLLQWQPFGHTRPQAGCVCAWCEAHRFARGGGA